MRAEAKDQKWISRKQQQKARQQWNDIHRRVHALPVAGQAAYARKITTWILDSIRSGEPGHLSDFCFGSEAALFELESPEGRTQE
jgi:hypothetical protein